MPAIFFLIYGGQVFLCSFTSIIMLRTVVSWISRTLFILVDFFYQRSNVCGAIVLGITVTWRGPWLIWDLLLRAPLSLSLSFFFFFLYGALVVCLIILWCLSIYLSIYIYIYNTHIVSVTNSPKLCHVKFCLYLQITFRGIRLATSDVSIYIDGSEIIRT